MFTGIIETLARLEQLEKQGSNIHFTFSSEITPELKIDQSIAHNGICLTVIKTDGQNYKVTAIEETLKRTNLSELRTGDFVNIERCLPATGRFDGHIVQGHIDGTATCIFINDMDGSWVFGFAHEKNDKYITVEKGSITINGVSLTVVQSTETTFSVHVIPYTYEHTNLKTVKVGGLVNVEYDIIGKYVARMMGK